MTEAHSTISLMLVILALATSALPPAAIETRIVYEETFREDLVGWAITYHIGKPALIEASSSGLHIQDASDASEMHVILGAPYPHRRQSFTANLRLRFLVASLSKPFSMGFLIGDRDEGHYALLVELRNDGYLVAREVELGLGFVELARSTAEVELQSGLWEGATLEGLEPLKTGLFRPQLHRTIYHDGFYYCEWLPWNGQLWLMGEASVIDLDPTEGDIVDQCQRHLCILNRPLCSTRASRNSTEIEQVQLPPAILVMLTLTASLASGIMLVRLRKSGRRLSKLFEGPRPTSPVRAC